MKKTLCLLYIICIALLSGCTSIYSSYREVEDLHLIQTIGIDEREEGVTVSISSGKSSNVKATAMSRSGETISEAIRALQSFSVSEDLFYSHIQYAVLGSDTAAIGINRALDFIERAGQIRMDIGLFIVRGGTAEEFIRGSSGASDSTAILKSLERAAKRTGESYVFSSQDIARDLLERNCALVSAIELKDTEGSVFSDTGEKTAIPVGYGLIKGDSLCGYITGDSARAVALLIGSDGIGQVTVETDRQVTLDVRTNGCEISPHWEDGRIKSMDIKIKLNCAIGELSEALPNLTEADYTEIDAALSEKAVGWVLEVLETQRLHSADFLGLGSRIRQKSPRDYSAAEAEWPAAMDDTMYNVTVESDIRRDYDLHAPER